jgi:hypothetical protein
MCIVRAWWAGLLLMLPAPAVLPPCLPAALLLLPLPQDTIITKDQRVFYVGFKWVQEYWPQQVEDGEHVSDVPVDLFLDSIAVTNPITAFKAKIRVYNTAAHLVICEFCQVTNRFIMVQLLCVWRVRIREWQPESLHAE